MRHTVCRSLAAISLALAAGAARAATRPRYGGSLRVEVRASLDSLDPAKEDATEAARSARRNLAPLLFDKLVALGGDGAPQPCLARAWDHSADFKRWQFWLRPAVKLSDGSVLTVAEVAASLAGANKGWRVSAAGDSVVIESELPQPNLPAELARTRNAIVVRNGSQLAGTGPFRIAEWQPGKRLLLRANEEYWDGRPYLDQVEIAFGQPLRAQALDLTLGRADVAEIAPEQARRALADTENNPGPRVAVSSPDQLLALVFARPAEDRLREALALSIDRIALANVILQRGGDAASSLLPQWISGYAFLFSGARDIIRARQLRDQSLPSRALALVYDPADPLARAVAERVAVNARDAGIAVQTLGQDSATADLRLVRLPLASPDPATALLALAGILDPGDAPHFAAAAAPEELYAAERDLLQAFRVIPLLHIVEAYGLSPRVRDWTEPRQGGWPLLRVWATPEAP